VGSCERGGVVHEQLGASARGSFELCLVAAGDDDLVRLGVLAGEFERDTEPPPVDRIFLRSSFNVSSAQRRRV
jgi:hypothetical protein